MNIEIFDSGRELALAAARRAAEIIEAAAKPRIVVAAGNSQVLFIQALSIDWSRVEAFHMDEYIGIPETHPASFRRWVREHVPGGRVHLLDPDDIDKYSEMINLAPIDVAFVGFGENGHIAFNDPHVADFKDPLTIKRVTLDEVCRRQQVGEGQWPDIAAVPPRAMTLTCPTLMAAEHIVCSVPDLRKAEAVRNALEGPVAETCPGSLVRTHLDAVVYLDRESASLLTSVKL